RIMPNPSRLPDFGANSSFVPLWIIRHNRHCRRAREWQAAVHRGVETPSRANGDVPRSPHYMLCAARGRGAVDRARASPNTDPRRLGGPGLCRMMTFGRTSSRSSRAAIRHNPAFGITSLMPHAALAEDVREIVSGSGWGVGADPAALGARFGSDHRA